MLTRQQCHALSIIDARIAMSGVAPTLVELASAMGLRSKGNAHRLLLQLEHRGYIQRLPCRARAMEVVKRPEALTRPFREARTADRGVPAIAYRGQWYVFDSVSKELKPAHKL